jgi:hypothetical protein
LKSSAATERCGGDIRERDTHRHTQTHTELNMEGVCLVCVVGSRLGAVTAKYGEKSVYFDLGDISNTTGKWDLYGNDEPNRYNGLQVDRYLVCSPPLAVLKICCRGFSAIS